MKIVILEEYQQKYMEMNFRVFDDYDFVQGELAWVFADFQTSEGIFRVGSNKKVVFTRDRKRWETKNGKLYRKQSSAERKISMHCFLKVFVTCPGIRGMVSYNRIFPKC